MWFVSFQQNVCTLAILKDFDRFRKYNLQSITEVGGQQTDTTCIKEDKNNTDEKVNEDGETVMLVDEVIEQAIDENHETSIKKTDAVEENSKDTENTKDTKEEPTKEEPIKEEPTKEEPTKEEPIKEEPTKEEPTKEEPTKEEPTKEEPTNFTERPEESSNHAQEATEDMDSELCLDAVKQQDLKVDNGIAGPCTDEI